MDCRKQKTQLSFKRVRKKEKGPFLLAAMRVVHQTGWVLRFHHINWNEGWPFDVDPCIEAMKRLCEYRHVNPVGLEHLRQIKAVVDAILGSVDPNELKRGEESADQYWSWLSSEFPEAVAQMRAEEKERTRKQSLN